MKTCLFLICSLFSLVVCGQEIEETTSFSEQKSLGAEAFGTNTNLDLRLGQFQAQRFLLPTNLSFDRGNDPQSINILAIGQAQERSRRANMRGVDFPWRQVQQIKLRVEVYYGQRGFWDRTSNNLNPYGQNTPDGGIRNEVYEDIRQPVINPYYNPYTRANFGYRPRNGFYIYRR